MPAAPLPDNEKLRLKALFSCNVLDTEPEARFDDLTALVSQICDMPIVLVSLVDTDRQWFKSRCGIGVDQTPRGQAFCGYTILQDQPLIIPDATQDPRTADNPLVTDTPAIRFYAGVPLILSDGCAVGTLCMIDTRVREVDDQQIKALQAIGRQVAAQLELNRLNAQLAASLVAARKANATKSMFLANMSHEIRTPMTAILGFSDIILEPSSTEAEQQNAAQTIRRNGEHLLALINDILDVSKIEAGKLDIECVPTPICGMLSDVTGLLDQRAREKALALGVTFDGQIPETIHTDPTRLKQALVNLIGNAIKFTESGGVCVTVRHLAEEGLLEIKIADTGIGMNEEQIGRLFKPFTQADTSTTRRFGGTGLGLTVTRQISRLLGGEVSADSTPGQGSVFTLRVSTGEINGVPMISSIRLEKQAAPLPADHSDQPFIDGHILLVEDGADNQRLITHILKKAGATVTLRENGQEGMEAALQGDEHGRPFDLILMDMQMPVMSGYDATRELRKRDYTGQIVALTAHAMDGEMAKCLKAGCDHYFTKPIERAAFIREIAKLIDKPSAGSAALSDKPHAA